MSKLLLPLNLSPCACAYPLSSRPVVALSQWGIEPDWQTVVKFGAAMALPMFGGEGFQCEDARRRQRQRR